MKRVMLSWESIPEASEDFELACSDEEFEVLKELAGKYINLVKTTRQEVDMLISLREKLDALKPINSNCINLKEYNFDYFIRCGEIL